MYLLGEENFDTTFCVETFLNISNRIIQIFTVYYIFECYQHVGHYNFFVLIFYLTYDTVKVSRVQEPVKFNAQLTPMPTDRQ